MSEETLLGCMLPLLFTLIGAGLLIGAGFSGKRTLSFLANAVETTGKVVALQEEPPLEAGDPVTYRPVVAFSVGESWHLTFKSMAHSNPPQYHVGDSVRVLYLRDDPHEARIRSFTSLWLLALILGGLGLVFTVVGLGLLTGFIAV